MKNAYYTVRKLIEKIPDAKYYMVFGERSNGKTYSVLDYAIEQYFLNGSELAIIRRWKEDFKGKNGASMFKNLVENKVIEKYSKGKYNGVTYYSQRWYFTYTNFDKKSDRPNEVSDTPFAYAFALTDDEHDKSTSYPKIRNILFDEFMTRKLYLPDEFIVFTGVLSTIIRDRNDVKIFMCGNTVNKYSPYFKEMGLTNVRNMKKGVIDVYTYGDSGLKVAVEYSDFPQKKKRSDVYFAFDNPKLKMITNGEWEIAIYPHLTIDMKYTPKDVIYHYYIVFENDILQCNIIMLNDSVFTYIHQKTTPIKNDNEQLVYTTEFSPLPNYRRKITRITSPIEERITWFFKHDKVFYQNNEIGEIVRNYLNWCKVSSLEQ